MPGLWTPAVPGSAYTDGGSLMTEQVTRHRGGGRDDNGQLVAASSTTLLAIGVAPRGGSTRVDRGRTGEDVACTVYFPFGTDIVDSDELTVRGKRYRIIVNDWQMQGRGGVEVLCVRGQG